MCLVLLISPTSHHHNPSLFFPSHITVLFFLRIYSNNTKDKMSSIVQTIQKKTTHKSLPVSSPADHDQLPALRRRLSSLSLHLHPTAISSSPAATWAIHRSKLLSSMGQNAGSSIKRWWEMGWAWVMSRKPIIVQDLEMNEEEKHFLGCQYKGSLMHLLFKLKSEFRKLLRYDDMTLPQTFRYQNVNNSHNAAMRRAALG